MNSGKIRIVIVDDHYLIRQGLVSVLATDPNLEVVAESDSGEQALEHYRQYRPDVMLLDINLPGISGIDVISKLRAAKSTVGIISLTSYETEGDISRSLNAGADGYLLKSTKRETLIEAIRTVAQGGSFVPPEIRRRFLDAGTWQTMTRKEKMVLEFLAKGLTNREIGEMMGTKETTIKSHVTAILSKLGAADRAEAVALAISERIIELE